MEMLRAYDFETERPQANSVQRSDVAVQALRHRRTRKTGIDMKYKTNPTARMATLDQLLETTIPVYLSPVPTKDTLRNWLDAARIPRFKPNPNAKRGGGYVFYSVAAVEKFLKDRTL